MNSLGRQIDYLRISVTDRCNERCLYCRPRQYAAWNYRADLLSEAELLRIVRVAATLGFRKFRLTGGEPLLRAGLVELVRAISTTAGVDYRPDYKGQITSFAMEVIEALQRELGLADVRPEFTRRNVFTRGMDLNLLVGSEFEIQDVRFAGTEECRPCYWMNNACRDERVEAWLRGRGGLRARILTDGILPCEPCSEAWSPAQMP